MSEHHLLLYTYPEDILERRGPYRDEHLRRIRVEQDAARILMAGAFGDPVSGGAIVWKGATADEIEAFVQGDPYLEAGLIVSYRIEPWTLV
ncbi:MAG TPA: YciI family protein [Solirubrobacteraceae bacterium]|nr:YciI family protein [Solirubrobacteraceae bacterium]